jgi:hypothetical protein
MSGAIHLLPYMSLWNEQEQLKRERQYNISVGSIRYCKLLCWIRMSGAIHLLPLCLYGMNRNNLNVKDRIILVLVVYDIANFCDG